MTTGRRTEWILVSDWADPVNHDLDQVDHNLPTCEMLCRICPVHNIQGATRSRYLRPPRFARMTTGSPAQHIIYKELREVAIPARRDFADDNR